MPRVRADGARHDAEAVNARGVALMAKGNHEQALANFDHVLKLDPRHPEAHNNRSAALQQLGRSVEALVSCERALSLRPDLLMAHENRAALLIGLGRLDEAEVAIDAAIRLAPRTTRSYFHLTEFKRLEAADQRFVAMRGLAEDAASLPADDQANLHFALGKACADQGDHDAAFRHLKAGNALRRAGTNYDEAATLRGLESAPANFRVEIIRQASSLGDPSPLPVFIVGMPRSGSTLVEQILASHPAVVGLGEADDFAKTLAEQNADPVATALPPAQRFRALGQLYLRRTAGRAGRARRVTDKTLGNFRALGLVHVALPNARIIHVHRDPRDVCVSCFSKQFTDQPFAFDLGELGRYYRAYKRLMDHWRAVIPANVLLEVVYEDVVADLEGQARRMLAHCGLGWDERCLDFHLNPRPVRTASASQVRRPIFGDSIGRWRYYEPHLGPLLSVLDHRVG
jgi:tetratricopeptide (TPR) repeat protein